MFVPLDKTGRGGNSRRFYLPKGWSPNTKYGNERSMLRRADRWEIQESVQSTTVPAEHP